MRKFVVSDIHGCVKTFRALLEKIHFSKSDELYLLGDYIDRGPDSKGVIDTILQLKAQQYTLHCLKGNHEDGLLSGLKDREVFYDWLMWGGIQTLRSFKAHDPAEIPQKYLDFFQSLKLHLEVDEYILVHAGLNFYTDDPLSDQHSLIWIRNWYADIDYQWLGKRIIVHGHTPISREHIKNLQADLEKARVINIDNGCFAAIKPHLGFLCAFELEGKELVFQENIDEITWP